MDLEMGVGPLPSEPVSMPPLLTSASDSTMGFSYRNPAYRSANPAPSKSKSSLSEVNKVVYKIAVNVKYLLYYKTLNKIRKPANKLNYKD